MVKLSVVIAHYGDPELARGLVAELLHQAPGLDVEVIVSDDAAPIPFPSVAGVTVLRRAANGGYGAAINTGAAAASGTHVVIMNSDLRLPPGFLHALAAAVRPEPEVISVAVCDDGPSPARAFPTPFAITLERLQCLHRWATSPWFLRLTGRIPVRPQTRQRVDWLQGHLLVVPLADFRAVGGFDERFFMYSEEVDLQRRLRARGVPAVLVSGLCVDHTGGESTPSDAAYEWLTRSQLTYFAKWGGERRLRRGLSAVAWLNAGWAALTGWRSPTRVGVRTTLRRQRALARLPLWPEPTERAPR